MKYDVAFVNGKNNEVLLSGVCDTDDKLEFDNRKSFKLTGESLLKREGTSEYFYEVLFSKVGEIVTINSLLLNGKFKVGLSSCGNILLKEVD